MSQKALTGIMTGDTAVEFQGVSKAFYQKQRAGSTKDALYSLFKPKYQVVKALDDVSFTVERGQILAYAGPNGAGKSTTIKMLCGLLAPDAGSISVISMNPLRDRVRYMRRAGVLFGQRTELWWDHPVSTSFEWKRVVWDIPKEGYDRMRNKLIELLDIGPFLNTHVRELSLGQRMRADLAMALLHEPDILLLDEPTLGLDVLAKRQMIGFLKDINHERGTTIIVTSHDMDDLMELAGRIILLDGGRISYDGDFDNLRSIIGGQRILLLTTVTENPPVLEGATYEKSQGTRHSYRVDIRKVSIISVLERVPKDIILDVETTKPPLEYQIAELYKSWAYSRREAVQRDNLLAR
jgi:ABC-2 type transport system ATP-binding protein